MLTLESQRLQLRATVADDLPALLPIYLSNPEYVSAHEGSRGEAGYYDLQMFQRDWHLATMMPGRHSLSLYLRATSEPVGIADYLEENPSDGMPWLGLLMIAGPHQRRGLGTEAFDRLAAHFRDELHWPTLRLGVRADNQPALAFWRRLGCRDVERAPNGAPSAVVVMERQLEDPRRQKARAGSRITAGGRSPSAGRRSGQSN
jgi:RimJ/RimL family protein N-acetyltransferase